MMETFQNKILPDNSNLIGLSWLVKYFNLNIPLRNVACVSQKRLASQRVIRDGWIQFDAVFKIDENPYAHLEFSIKHETIDLLVLKSILKHFPIDELIENIKQNPKRILSKKIWFYYEFLLNQILPIEDLPAGKYDNLLDQKKYIVRNHPVKSQRHKIYNNLLGTANLCPIIQRSQALKMYMNSDFKADISTIFKGVSKSLIRRAASFLLLSDSKASFEIEGERATSNRIESWGKIINEAGKIPLSSMEIERLHAILMEDARFMKIGLRRNEVFLGDRDRDNMPIPEFIGAKKEDLKTLIESWIELHEILTEEKLDPILHATIIAFSFVYIHPLEDGNGRIHRYLLHHILAERNFYPIGMIFPISSVILDEIENYREILVSHTSPLMSMIEWEAAEKGNVKILNNTTDLYRYFNITQSCEFIYRLVKKTIDDTLPQELNYLSSFDKVCHEVNEIVNMPDNMIKTLITFILQNKGKLSKKKKEKYYEELTGEELQKIEDIVYEIFKEQKLLNL